MFLFWVVKFSIYFNRRVFVMKVIRVSPVIPKEIKYNLHYGEERGTFDAAIRQITRLQLVKNQNLKVATQNRQ